MSKTMNPRKRLTHTRHERRIKSKYTPRMIELMAWCTAHPTVWAGWPTHRSLDGYEMHRLRTQLNGALAETSLTLIGDAIANVRLQKRTDYEARVGTMI